MENVNDDKAVLTLPILVPHRGNAHLEIAGGLTAVEGSLTPPTAQMAIACLSLASMLLVHRHARVRLKAIGAIHEILLAVTDEWTSRHWLDRSWAWRRWRGTSCWAWERESAAIQQVKEAVHEVGRRERV
jgi:hypothetical protein